MIQLLNTFNVLAEAPAGEPGGGLGALAVPMVAIAIMWYFLLLKPQRREQKKREELLTGIKKNDSVVTIGGIIGTVTNVSDDGQEVTLRVDDTARIKFLRSSIQTIRSKDGEDSGR